MFKCYFVKYTENEQCLVKCRCQRTLMRGLNGHARIGLIRPQTQKLQIYLTKTPYILYSGINGLNPNISELVKKICLTKNLRPWESVDLFLFSHDLHVCLTSVTVRRN